MATELRKTGISVVGDVPWGTHFWNFYETKEDLLDTLVPYFKTGLENNEFCIWVVSEPLTAEEVTEALRQAVPCFDQYVAERSLEILRMAGAAVPGSNWDSRSLRFPSGGRCFESRAINNSLPDLSGSFDECPPSCTGHEG